MPRWPVPIERKPAEPPVAVAEIVEVAEAPSVIEEATVLVPVTPYSDRLSLDTRLDPGTLVSADDLPTWLGGLERTVTSIAEGPALASVAAAAPVAVIEEPEPYAGVDAPQEAVIDVQVNGWYMIAGRSSDC